MHHVQRLLFDEIDRKVFSMSQILVIGSVALDTVTTPVGRSKEVLGGSATYFAISASFFTHVNIVATVGKDFPRRYMDLIRSFGIDTAGIEKKDGKTFRWEGSYIDDLNCARTIQTQLNVFADFRPVIPERYKKSRFLFLANIDPDLQLFILKKSYGHQFVGCDSMNYWIQNKCISLKRLMKKVSFVFLNDAEARLFSGETNIIKSGRFILSLGPRFVIIKRGEYGAILFNRDEILLLTPAYLLEAVCDPTGAGDTFAGGFMGYLAKMDRINNQNVRNALLYGSVMASFAVEDFSVDGFLKLGRRKIDARYRKFRKLTIV